jgi:hypothetical protein
MITAHQARVLVQSSEQMLLKRLEDIGKKIEEAAKLGKNHIILDHVLPYEPEFKVIKPDYQPPQLTSVQQLIKNELQSPKIGFSVSVVEQKHDGKGGLGNMDDDPKPFSTWHIRVGW